MSETQYSTGIRIEGCRWCGRHHPTVPTCPEVKAMEFHPNGAIKRVEFRDPPRITWAELQMFPILETR